MEVFLFLHVALSEVVTLLLTSSPPYPPRPAEHHLHHSNVTNPRSSISHADCLHTMCVCVCVCSEKIKNIKNWASEMEIVFSFVAYI